MRLIATTPAQTVQRTLSGVGSAAVTAGSAGMRRAGRGDAGGGGATPPPRAAGRRRQVDDAHPGGRGQVDEELVEVGVGDRRVRIGQPSVVLGEVEAALVMGGAGPL